MAFFLNQLIFKRLAKAISFSGKFNTRFIIWVKIEWYRLNHTVLIWVELGCLSFHCVHILEKYGKHIVTRHITRRKEVNFGMPNFIYPCSYKK